MANAPRCISTDNSLPNSDAAELVLSIAQAAKVCGVSVDTIRRRLNSGGLPGAARCGATSNAAWLIPASTLLYSGLCTPDALSDLEDSSNSDSKLNAQVAELNATLAIERAQREMAEQMLTQAQSEIDHLRRMVDRLLPEMASSGAWRAS